MHRVYIPKEKLKSKEFILEGPVARHVFLVLRLKARDKFLVFDGMGQEYEAVIQSVKKGSGILRLHSIRQIDIPRLKITLAAAIPKKYKFEEIIVKATQLGVDTIIPLISSRTIVKIKPDKIKYKQERWQRIAIEAAAQSGSAYVPKVETVKNFKEVLKQVPGFDLALIACLDDKDTPFLKDVIRGRKSLRPIIFTGPEGDFDKEEIRSAELKGCVKVSLGQNILRCDTAVTCVLAVLNYEWTN